MDKNTEYITRARMHGLYLSRKCEDIVELSRELMGLHCWFHRNVAFSAVIRGAGLAGWKQALTKTWLYRGTLHGVDYNDLPTLLALHQGDSYLKNYLGEERLFAIGDRVIALMEDGVCSRAEMRRVFAYDLDAKTIDAVFSPWGGIFVHLARQGRVAFRHMTSRDFDLVSAEPSLSAEAVLPELLRRFFAAYGPATLADAAWFFGFWKDGKKMLAAVDLSGFGRLELDKRVYYYTERGEEADIPELTLLSGFDPYIVSYTERSAILPAEHKSAVILKSGICHPTVALRGQVAGIWNIKKNEPVVEFFSDPGKRIRDLAYDLVCDVALKTGGFM